MGQREWRGRPVGLLSSWARRREGKEKREFGPREKKLVFPLLLIDVRGIQKSS
jgi:hypothetical protein